MLTIENATVPDPGPGEVRLDFDELFAVNVRAPFFLVQQLLPVLTEGSRIVLVSSLAARTVVPNLAAYAATQGAIAPRQRVKRWRERAQRRDPPSHRL